MITLFASLAGFISSLFPSLIKIVTDRQDKQHELAILKKQLELHKSGIGERLQEIQAVSAAQETVAIYKTYHSGIDWVDALNATVRPTLAYAFFAMYGIVKYLQWHMMSQLPLPTVLMVEVLWNGEDQAIFAGIISFYYGQRALGKLSQRRA